MSMKPDQKPTYLFLFIFAVMLFMHSCQEPCVVPEFVAGTRLDTIPKEKVQELQQNFNSFIGLCRQREMLIEEHNNVWFSIESLTNYLSYAKHISDSLSSVGVTQPNVSGIRLYFGKNEKNELTVVASATYKANATDDSSADDNDLGFGVLNYGHAGRPPKKDYPHPPQ